MENKRGKWRKWMLGVVAVPVIIALLFLIFLWGLGSPRLAPVFVSVFVMICEFLS